MLRTTITMLFLLVFISACAAPSPASTVEVGSATQVSPTLEIDTKTPSVDTNPVPTSSPPATEAVISRVFGEENYPLFTNVGSYDWKLKNDPNLAGKEFMFAQTVYSADGRRFAAIVCVGTCYASSGGINYVAVVDTLGEDPIVWIKDEKSDLRLWRVAFSADGNTLYYSIKGMVMAFDLTSKLSSVLWSVDAEINFPYIDVSADGTKMAISVRNTLALLELPSGRQIAQINGVFYGGASPFFNPDGSQLAVYNDENYASLTYYDSQTLSVIKTMSTTGMGSILFTPEGSILAVNKIDDTTLSLVDVETGYEFLELKHGFYDASSIVFNPDGTLILINGVTGDTMDLFASIQVYDAQTGEKLGFLVSDATFGTIQFSQDGTSFLYSNGYNFQKWAIPTDEFREVDALIQNYFTAITQKDYQAAAEMSAPDNYTQEEIVSAGLDPADLPFAYESLCSEDEIPCLPLGRIARIGEDSGEYWDYIVFVSLVQPDGSEVMFDGITRYELMGVVKDADGSLKIATLHPGMRYPYNY